METEDYNERHVSRSQTQIQLKTFDQRMATDNLDHVFKILLIGDAGVGKSRYFSFPLIDFHAVIFPTAAFYYSLPTGISTKICRVQLE
jgi:hypothetical protein